MMVYKNECCKMKVWMAWRTCQVSNVSQWQGRQTYNILEQLESTATKAVNGNTLKNYVHTIVFCHDVFANNQTIWIIIILSQKVWLTILLSFLSLTNKEKSDI